MKPSFYKVPSLLSISSLVLLAACGGGGGGGDNDSGVPTQGNSAITVDNAPTVAREVTSTMDALDMSADESFKPMSAETKAASLIDVSVQHLRQVLSNRATNLAIGIAATEEGSVGCTNGGTISYIVNYANPSAITKGDSITINYNNCKYAADSNLTGGFKVTFISVAGEPYSNSAWSMNTQTEFKNFLFTAPDYSNGINGGLTLKFAQTQDYNYNYVISGNSLQVSETENGLASSYAISSFNQSGEGFNELETYRTNFTVFGKAPQLTDDLSYVVKTTKDFKENEMSPYAHQGEIFVTATNKSTLRFTVIDNTKVQIAVDTDGNGTVDDTRTMTWQEFYAE